MISRPCDGCVVLLLDGSCPVGYEQSQHLLVRNLCLREMRNAHDFIFILLQPI